MHQQNSSSAAPTFDLLQLAPELLGLVHKRPLLLLLLVLLLDLLDRAFGRDQATQRGQLQWMRKRSTVAHSRLGRPVVPVVELVFEPVLVAPRPLLGLLRALELHLEAAVVHRLWRG